MLNGLVNGVGKRVQPHISKVMQYLTQSISDRICADGMGTRLACGLISDFCTHLDDHMMKYVLLLIPVLLKNLQDPDMPTESKLLAIIAVGDLLLCCDCSQYLSSIMQIFESAAEISLQTSCNEDE